jgi:hypothetical protein
MRVNANFKQYISNIKDSHMILEHSPQNKAFEHFEIKKKYFHQHFQMPSRAYIVTPLSWVLEKDKSQPLLLKYNQVVTLQIWCLQAQ